MVDAAFRQSGNKRKASRLKQDCAKVQHAIEVRKVQKEVGSASLLAYSAIR